MKQQLVIKEALGKNTSRALQEAARCSCLRNVCLPGSSEVNSLVFVWYLICLISCCPRRLEARAVLKPAAQVQPGWTDEH